MPDKVVRFEEYSEYHLYDPSTTRTPSPSFSESTLSTSPGLMTPPNPRHPPLHAAYKSNTLPLPSLDDSDSALVALHELLEYSWPPHFEWAVSTNPDVVFTESQSLTSRTLMEAATTPPLPEIVLLSRRLPWRIGIQASDTYVTIDDVISGLHRILQRTVSDTELAKESEEQRKSLREAFEQRCRKLEQIDLNRAHNERSNGMRRLDFLMGNHRFLGLSKCADGEPNTFKFSVTSERT